MLWKTPVPPDFIYCVLKCSENSYPAELPPGPTAGVYYSKVFPAYPHQQGNFLPRLPFAGCPKGLASQSRYLLFPSLYSPRGAPPQTAVINAHTISFLSENCPFWFPNKQQKRHGTSCSPARGTEGADLVSLRQGHNQEGEYELGWLSLHKHFIHAVQTPLPSS